MHGSKKKKKPHQFKKKKPDEWDKIFATIICGNGLISNIYQQFIQSKSKTTVTSTIWFKKYVFWGTLWWGQSCGHPPHGQQGTEETQ